MNENEINLIVDIIGTNVNHVYQMNLQYQGFAVIQNAVTIGVMIVTFICVLLYARKMANENPYERDEIIVILGLFGNLLISVLTGWVVYMIFQYVLLPGLYPEYPAMLQTLSQISELKK